MSMWQVAAVGWGFMKDGGQQDCELSGLVRANNPDEAFSKVCSIAMQDYPELQQATGPFPRPVVNADEIQEVFETQLVGVDHVELFWIKK
ncbi:MAG: hypothetical protein ACLGI6_10990 [Gammaproteobacteria bacterium]